MQEPWRFWAQSQPQYLQSKSQPALSTQVKGKPSSASSGLTGRFLWTGLGGVLPKDKVSNVPIPTPKSITTAETLVTKPPSHKPLSGLPC